MSKGSSYEFDCFCEARLQSVYGTRARGIAMEKLTIILNDPPYGYYNVVDMLGELIAKGVKVKT
jgi:hypothetical protein